jgi:hypothetical protein
MGDVKAFYFISWFTGPPTLKFPISGKKLNWNWLFFPPANPVHESTTFIAH